MTAQNTLRLDRVLTTSEIETVLSDLHRRGKRSANSRTNEVVFRLATICGLRVSEIATLTMGNVRSGDRPHIRVVNGKGGKTATVPIPDTATVRVLINHMISRVASGGGSQDPLVAKSGKHNAGQPFNRSELAKRFKTACRALGEERIARLSVHDGRHTAATQLLERGKSLATVRDFLRHSNISTTSAYLHGAELKPEEMYKAEGD